MGAVKEKVEALSKLTDFVNVWFPDCLDEDEQQEIRETLALAETKCAELNQAFQQAVRQAKSL